MRYSERDNKNNKKKQKMINALKKVGYFISSIINFVLLLFVYLVGGLISFLIIGKKGRNLFGDFNEKRDSFWSEREKDKEENLYRQF